MSRIGKHVWMTALSAALLLLADGRAWAQCSMCRTALETQGPNAAITVNLAILVLLFPAVALFSGVFVVAFRTAKTVQTGVEHEEVR